MGRVKMYFVKCRNTTIEEMLSWCREYEVGFKRDHNPSGDNLAISVPDKKAFQIGKLLRERGIAPSDLICENLLQFYGWVTLLQNSVRNITSLNYTGVSIDEMPRETWETLLSKENDENGAQAALISAIKYENRELEYEDVTLLVSEGLASMDDFGHTRDVEEDGQEYSYYRYYGPFSYDYKKDWLVVKGNH